MIPGNQIALVQRKIRDSILDPLHTLTRVRYLFKEIFDFHAILRADDVRLRCQTHDSFRINVAQLLNLLRQPVHQHQAVCVVDPHRRIIGHCNHNRVSQAEDLLGLFPVHECRIVRIDERIRTGIHHERRQEHGRYDQHQGAQRDHGPRSAHDKAEITLDLGWVSTHVFSSLSDCIVCHG